MIAKNRSALMGGVAGRAGCFECEADARMSGCAGGRMALSGRKRSRARGSFRPEAVGRRSGMNVGWGPTSRQMNRFALSFAPYPALRATISRNWRRDRLSTVSGRGQTAPHCGAGIAQFVGYHWGGALPATATERSSRRLPVPETSELRVELWRERGRVLSRKRPDALLRRPSTSRRTV